MTVDIPFHYWEGKENLEKGCPWLTPGAIIYLDSHIQSFFKVLELGSGGSTVFFAKRCAQVTSIETSEEWHKKVKDSLTNKNMSNVQLLFLSIDECKQYIYTLPDNSFDLVLIDPGYRRKRVMFTRMCINKLKAGGLLVIDNYAWTQRTKIGLTSKIRLTGWISYFFDDPYHSGWGDGTSINIKPFPYQTTMKYKIRSVLVRALAISRIEKSKLFQIVYSKLRSYKTT